MLQLAPNFAPINTGFGYQPQFGMNSMMMMMRMMLQVMSGLMSMMGGGNATMPYGSPGFGQQMGAPFGTGSPLGGFLGGGAPMDGGGSAGSAAIPFNQGLNSEGGVGGKTQAFINAAKSKQGAPYVFGAAGPDKFDCSGLVSWALKQAGSNAPRLTAEGYRQRYKGTAVGREQLKPGDLVFFHSANNRGIGPGKATHVEIYLGNGMTMGTDSPKEGAKIEPINWSTFIGGARAPELQG